MDRKLFRSRYNRIIAGVCGGIGQYFSIDPTIIRIIWAICSFNGIGIIAYIIALILIPEEDTAGYYQNTGYDTGDSGVNFDNPNTNLVIGGILVLVGIILIARRFIPWFDSKLIWSLLLIAVGVIIILKGWRGRR